ncbi:MAG: septum formation family protein [Nocardioides sp.]
MIVAAVLGVPALLVAGVYLFGHYFVGADAVPRDSSGHVTERTQVPSTDIELGDCLDDDQMAGLERGSTTQAEVMTVELVPCDQPHQFEAYVVEDLAGGDYPGADSVQKQTQRRCAAAFKSFVGTGLRRSDLEVAYYFPVEQAWPGDREIVCMLSEPDHATTGSLRDSAR